jgi:hypothetical protein
MYAKIENHEAEANSRSLVDSANAVVSAIRSGYSIALARRVS